MSDLTDQILSCKDCRSDFIFAVKDQIFFTAQGFTPPKRCRPCRDANKARRNEGGGNSNSPQASAPAPSGPPARRKKVRRGGEFAED